MSRSQGDLPERTLKFGVLVVSLIRSLPNDTAGWTVAKHLMRSGTSIGANIHEAHVALSDADFAHCCNIARKEASETLYWLMLCQETELLQGSNLDHAMGECEELIKILSTIVQKTHARMGR